MWGARKTKLKPGQFLHLYCLRPHNKWQQIHTHTHTQTDTNTLTSTQTHILALKHTHARVRTRTHTHTHTHTFIHSNTLINTQKNIYTHTHQPTHTHTHTHIQTHIQAQAQQRLVSRRLYTATSPPLDKIKETYARQECRPCLRALSLGRTVRPCAWPWPDFNQPRQQLKF